MRTSLIKNKHNQLWVSSFWYWFSWSNVDNSPKTQCPREVYILFFLSLSLHVVKYWIQFAYISSAWYLWNILSKNYQPFLLLFFSNNFLYLSPNLLPDTLPVFRPTSNCENRWTKKWKCVYKIPWICLIIFTNLYFSYLSL